jgi:hypothetical protein
MPHPIERLRYVARAGGVGVSALAEEAAGALARFASDPPGLVTGCRRLVARNVTVGPLWWLSARVLTAADPMHEASHAARALAVDPTAAMLAALIPDDASVVVLGWPEQLGDALRKRGDLEVFVVDVLGEGAAFVRRLEAVDVDAVDVRESGLGSAVAEADLLLLEASALGPSGFVAVAGSRAAAAVAHAAGVPVWVVAGVGRVLPARLWDVLVSEVDAEGDPWELDEEIVPIGLADQVIGPDGLLPAAQAYTRADCPVAPELLKLGT